MDNQHRKITGYRELTQEEIDLMNEIKAKGAELDQLIEILRAKNMDACALNSKQHQQQADAHRWISIGKTHLQQGLMALTRAVAKPDFF